MFEAEADRSRSRGRHIVPVKAPGGQAFPALDWLMSCCAACHNRKTRGEQLGKELPIKGCDIYGYPLDPRHPWYQGSPLRDKERRDIKER
jgi:hypothetical protein